MTDDERIIRLLTEIRDNQLKQMEGQLKYREWAEGATVKQQRGAIIASVALAVGVMLLITFFMLK